MASLSVVLSQITDRLRESGAQFSLRVLEIISAAMSFLQTIGNPPDDEVATAGYITSLLTSNDAQTAAIALGVSPNLIPALTLSSPIITVDYQLGQVLGRGSAQEAVVAATVLYSWHAVAAKAGHDDRVTALRKIANTATLQGSQNQALAQTLAAEMAKVQVTSHQALASGEYLFSISIDLVGSTDAKTRVMKLTQGDVQKIDALNSRIYREFCRIEKKFYESAVGQYGASSPIDPSKFFTVKGIGDEIWILCDVAKNDVAAVGHALIDAAIEVANQQVNFLATQNDDGPSFDPDFDYGKIEPIKSPVKIFIDLVSHASSLGRMRDEGLIDAIPNLLKSFHRRDATPLEIATVARRLCLSSYEPIGWWIFHEFRTDYIGHEIDRFFRTTKAAIPGTVTIGASMARQMGLSFKPVAHGLHAVFRSGNAPLMGGVPSDPVHARIRPLKSEELKGIGYGYDTYTLFAPRSLKARYVQMDADRENEVPVTPYHDTAALISPEELDEIVEEIIKTQQN